VNVANHLNPVIKPMYADVTTFGAESRSPDFDALRGRSLRACLVFGSMEGRMNLGFESVRDVLEALLVPIALALLAVGWPAIAERRKRMNFENLTRRELMEAKPHVSRNAELLWHEPEPALSA
jgi:hypothetical protein